MKLCKSLVGNHIRKLRFNSGEMTQQQLADQVGVTRQTIVALEKGNYSPSLELAFRIAMLLTYRWKKCFFMEITIMKVKKENDEICRVIQRCIFHAVKHGSD